MTGKIHIFPDKQALNSAVAQAWQKLSAAAINERGAFHVALSGGSTPKSLFQLLASPEWRERFDWQHIHIYFGDEAMIVFISHSIIYLVNFDLLVKAIHSLL